MSTYLPIGRIITGSEWVNLDGDENCLSEPYWKTTYLGNSNECGKEWLDPFLMGVDHMPLAEVILCEVDWGLFNSDYGGGRGYGSIRTFRRRR